MGLIKSCRGKTPKLGHNCYLAENATLIGDVIAGNDCSFWFNSVVRGDVNSIRIGNKVNVQDGAVIHCTYRKAPTVIGNNVSIAHNAIVHGCKIEDNVLIGMGSIVMDHVVVESNCVIAAGSVILEGTRVPGGEVWAGVPARKIKDLPKDLLEGEILRIAENYIMYASWFR